MRRRKEEREKVLLLDNCQGYQLNILTYEHNQSSLDTSQMDYPKFENLLQIGTLSFYNQCDDFVCV